MSPTRNPRGPGMEITLCAEVRRGDRSFTATTRGLALDGLAVECAAGLATGDAVRVSLYFVIDGVEDETRPPLEVQGTIESVTPGSKRGQATAQIKFGKVSKFQAAGLAKFLRVLGQE